MNRELKLHGVISVCTPWLSVFLLISCTVVRALAAEYLLLRGLSLPGMSSGEGAPPWQLLMEHIPFLYWVTYLTPAAAMVTGPVFCAAGMLRGLRRRKEKASGFCLWMSILGLLVHVGLTMFFVLLGYAWGEDAPPPGG